MHEETYRWSSGWVNMTPFDTPRDYSSMWERLAEFFSASWDDVMSKYNDLILDAEERDAEKKEREELARLKAKYEK